MALEQLHHVATQWLKRDATHYHLSPPEWDDVGARLSMFLTRQDLLPMAMPCGCCDAVAVQIVAEVVGNQLQIGFTLVTENRSQLCH